MSFINSRKTTLGTTLVILGMAAGGSSCGSSTPASLDQAINNGSSPRTTYSIFGVVFNPTDQSNELVSMSSDSVGTLSMNTPVTGGLQPGEKILGISFSPDPNGGLFALGSTSRIYSIDPTSAIATVAGTGAPFTPALNGNHFGLSFNPVTYQLRVTSDQGQNLRLDKNSGQVVAQDPTFTYASDDVHATATPDIVTIASTCHCTAVTTLYGIDAALGLFVSLGESTLDPNSPDNSGVVHTVGLLGSSFSGTVALALPKDNTLAFASSAPSGSSVSTIYQIDLSSGNATSLGSYTGVGPIQALSVQPN